MTDWEDRYGGDVLADFRKTRGVAPATPTPLTMGLVLEDASTGFTGAVVRIGGGFLDLEDRAGGIRTFPTSHGFLVDGARVRLVKAGPAAEAGPKRTASGSFAVEDQRARVALPSRIWVEGRHDAELVERVWGDDLRVEGVVVEYLEGVDLLQERLDEFRPGAGRKVGVLVDHLVAGSKEARIADAVARGPHGAHVRVVGHPFIDIWQAVKPSSVGIPAWPTVPRGTDWKHGVCEALGWPHADQADIARVWQHILGRVRSFQDLEPTLLGRVEELIDFVTAD